MCSLRFLARGALCAGVVALFSLSPAAAQSTLSWNGSQSAAWNINAAANWWDPANSLQTTYPDGANVVFGDGAANTNITVAAGGVQPSSMTFTANTTPYTFVGGPINGGGSVTLNGSGSVTFNSANNYNGGTIISAGTLVSTSQQSLGSGPVTLSGGNLMVLGGFPGLQEGWFNGAFDTTDPFSASAVQSAGQLSPRAANWTTSNGAGTASVTSGNFPNNATAIYSGQIFLGGGQVSFYKNFDDNMLLTIAGNQIINNQSYNQLVTATYTPPAPGWYSFELRLGQGGGGVGPNIAGYTYGLGYDPNGNGGTTNGNYVFPTDPGNGSLFKYGGGNADYVNSVNVTSPSALNASGQVSFGGSLSLGSALHIGGYAGTVLTFSGGTTLSGAPTLNIDAGVNVTLTSPVSDGGTALAITKNGGGALTLSGTNTFTAGTNFQVNGGNLIAVGQSYTAPGPASGPLGSAPITLNNGALVLAAASSSAATSTFDLDSENVVTFSGSNNSIIAGSVLAGVGSGSITLAGSNPVTIAAGQTLNLGAANGYTLTLDPGLHFITSGTLASSAGNILLPAANLNVPIGTLSASNGGTLTLINSMSSGKYSPIAGGTVVLSGTYSGTLGNLAPAAGGILVINNNVTSGTLNVVNGGYYATTASSFGPSSGTAAVKLQLSGGTLGATTALTGANAVANPLFFLTLPRTLNFGGGSKLELSSSLALVGPDTLNDPGGIGTLSGSLSGAGNLTITGSPTLSHANVYAGGTTLGSTSSSLFACPTITNNQAFGPGTITFNNGGFQASTPLTGANAVSNPWKISNGSAACFGGANAIQLTASTTLPAFGTASIHILNPNLTVTLSGLISGNCTLIRAADAAGQTNGTLVINNPGNTFFQGFKLQSLGGNVDVQGASTSPAGATGTSVTSGPLGTFTVNLGDSNAGYINLLNSSATPVTLGNTVTIYDAIGFGSVSGLTLSGPMGLAGPDNGGIAQIYLGANNNIAFTGVISNAGGSGINLRQGSGSGGLTLGGLNNYTGATSITMGTLIAGGNAPASGLGVFGNATSAITIGDGNSGGAAAALVTNGPYTIGRPITVNAVSPGAVTLGSIAGGASSTFSGAIVLSGTNSGTLFSAAAGGSVVFSGNISGASPFGLTAASPGNGNVVLTASNTYTGPTTVNSGRLTLDYSVGNLAARIVPAASTMVLSGGTLAFNGSPSTALNESFTATRVAGFGSTLVVNPNGSPSVQIGLRTITRSGGVLDLPANAVFTTSSSNSNGILGGYLTVNGCTDWATNVNDANGTIVSLTQVGGYLFDNYSAAANNVDVFNGSPGLTASATVNSLRFNFTGVGNLLLNGNTLALASGGILVTSGVGGDSEGIGPGVLTVVGTTAANTLADVAVIQANTAAAFTIGASITNSGTVSVGLTKGGPGVLVLAGSNTYSGPTTVSGGTLQGSIGAGNFGANPSIAVNYGAGVDLIENGAAPVTKALAITGAGALSKDGSSSLTTTGAVTANSLSVLNGTYQINGAATVSGPVSVAGGAALVLNGTTSSVGLLSGGGALSLTGVVSENATGNSTFSGTIAGTGSFSKAGPGMLTLTNPGSSYSGTVRIPAGTLQLGSATALQDATLDMNDADVGVLNTSTAGLSSLTLGGLMGTRSLGTPAGPLTIGGGNTSTTYTGNLSGATALTKVGSGSLYLSGSNGFATVTVSNGVLGAATTASLAVYGTAGKVSVGAGGGLAVATGDGLSGWSSGQIGTLVGNVTWGGSTSLLGIDTTNGSLTLANSTPALSIMKQGPNSLTLTGSNTLAAMMTVNGGAVNLLGANASVGGLAGGGGNLVLGNSVGPVNTTLTVNSAGNTTFSGVISQAAAAVGSLLKTGSGTLTLGGSNTYSGGTSVNQGTLVAKTATGLGSGPLNLNGGTLRFNLPPSATNVDIGSPGLAGSGTYANGAWTVTGGGGDVWTNTDQCHYLYIPAATGTPATWIAHIASLTPNANDTGWSKSGIMARASNNTLVADVFNAETTSNNVTFQWTSAANTAPNNNVNGSTPAPQWLEVTYDGNGNFNAFYSNSTATTPPASWTQLGTQQNVAMPAGGFEVGLFTTSHANGNLSTGVFDYASFLSPSTAINLPGTSITVSQSSNLDVGLASNAMFGSLALQAGVTLNVAGSAAGYQVAVGPTSVAGNAAVSVANPAGGAGALVVGPLSGSGNLSFSGPGALVVTSSANGFSGQTILSGGTLVAANASGSATGSGQVTLNGGVLAGTVAGGAISGLVQAGSGPHTVAPGAGLPAGQFGLLNLNGGLDTNANTTLSFNLNLTSSSSIGNDGGGNPIFVGDLISFGGSALNVAGGRIAVTAAPSTLGDYRLMAGGSYNNTNLLALPTAPAGDKYTLSTSVEPGYLDLVLSVAPAGTFSGNATWVSTSDPNWSNVQNWRDNVSSQTGAGAPGIGTAGTDTATLNGSDSVGNISLDQPVNLSALTMSATNYKLSGANTLTLQGTAGTANVTVTGGAQEIDSPVSLASSLLIALSGDTVLTVSGNITQTAAGMALVLGGDGSSKLVLAGSNNYSATIVSAGVLMVSHSYSLGDNSNLTVGNGSVFTAAPASGGFAPAVPEPGTLALLAVAGIVAAAAWRRRSQRRGV